jgi:hypothetical protein
MWFHKHERLQGRRSARKQRRKKLGFSFFVVISRKSINRFSLFIYLVTYVRFAKE